MNKKLTEAIAKAKKVNEGSTIHKEEFFDKVMDLKAGYENWLTPADMLSILDDVKHEIELERRG